ncbi:uncharacterized protein [Pyrus communis]|uniref:uncharacterized protein n=1 Tax=Pyrus communis TaxID=23211 RepID=UPI0035C1DC63
MGNPEGGPSAYDGDHDLYQPQVEVDYELQADQQSQYQQVSETTRHDHNQQDQYQEPPPQPPNNAPQNNYDPQAQPQGVFQQLPPSQPQPAGFPPPQGPPQQNPYQTPTPQPAQFPPQSPQQFPPQNPQFQNQQQEANYQQPRPAQFPPQPQSNMQTNPNRNLMYANVPNQPGAVYPPQGPQPMGVGNQQAPAQFPPQSPAQFPPQSPANYNQQYQKPAVQFSTQNQQYQQQQPNNGYAVQGVPMQQSPYQQGPLNHVNLQNAGTEQWSSELFDCMDDPMNALTTAFVPCLTFGQIAEVIDNGTSSCATSGLFYGLIASFIGIPFIMSCTYRTKLRSKYNLIESPAPDWVTHLFCEPCALCQEYRELQVRGIDPSIGWIGNVQRNPSLQQPNVNMMMPPMNQNMNQY